MSSHKKVTLALMFVVMSLSVSGCSSMSSNSRYHQKKDGHPTQKVDIATVSDAVPKVEPLSRYGNPASYEVNGKRYNTLKSSKGFKQRGLASWYGTKFHNYRTSSGEPYNMFAMTAAHTSLPLPTYVRVTNLENGKKVIVKVNDRGPFHSNRVIDLSYVAAKKLGIVAKGTGVVEVEAIDPRMYAKAQGIRDDASIVAPMEHPKLYLQVGAFSQMANAKQLATKVKALTKMPVRILRVFRTNLPTLYRVQIGPVSTVAESDKLSDELSYSGLGDAKVVVG